MSFISYYCLNNSCYDEYYIYLVLYLLYYWLCICYFLFVSVMHNYILNYYSRKVFTIFYYETLIYLIQNGCIIDKHAVIYKYCFIIQCSYTNRSRLRWRTFVINCNYMFVVVVFSKYYNICLTFYLSNWKLTTKRSKFCFSIKVCIYLHLW